MIDEGAPFHTGDILADRYRVEHMLGRGAMGFVLAVMDLERQERRAIKLLAGAALAREATVERFFREARALGRLTSEHAVRVFGAGLLEGGRPYLVMEHLEGADLSTVVKRRGVLPAHEAARYVLEACEALSEAHAHGIVHRDLKPHNLFLARREGAPPCIKVLDFGLSRQVLTDPDDPRLTLSDEVLGSPAYMSPEQILSARSADARSDVWSLGVVLYQLVTGRLPFASADAIEMVRLVRKGAAAPPSTHRAGLPLAFDGVVMRCLEKDPALRYPSTAALAEALGPFVRGAAPASHTPTPTPAPTPAPPRRGLRLAIAIAIAVGVGLALAAAALATLRG